MGKNKEKTYQEYVRDLGYEIEAWPRLSGLSCPILKASKDGLLFTVKFGDLSCSEWEHEHVVIENRVLDRMRGVEGIVEKKSFHKLEQDKFVALVRHYVEGETIVSQGGGFDRDILINAVKALHKNNIARLDLCPKNIIIDPSRKPWIIDLGFCVFAEDIDFLEVKRMDLKRLEYMLKEYGG